MEKPISQRDFSGKRFGLLLVLRKDSTCEKPPMWICECDCGLEVSVSAYQFTSGKTKSCGCLRSVKCRSPHYRDLTGVRFGRLTVVRRVGSIGKRPLWLCMCDCGEQKTTDTHSLSLGTTSSCGCLRREQAKINAASGASKRPKKAKPTKPKKQVKLYGGFAKTSHPLWYTYKGIFDRCYKRSHEAYPRYGGRGIKVCERWRGVDGFSNFLIDVGEKPSTSHSIDRFPDNNGDYGPSNVRWATQEEQCRNKRNNRVISYNGREMCLAEWAEELGISLTALRQRISKKWDIQRAFSEPVRKKQRRTKTVVWTNGCFDLLGPHHLGLLQKSRSLGDMLVVGLNTDDSVRVLKGKSRPIMTYEERKIVLESLRCVDMVVPINETEPSNAIRRIRPQIVTKGFAGKENCWNKENMPELKAVEEVGAKVVFFDGPEWSTTMLIERLKNA